MNQVLRNELKLYSFERDNKAVHFWGISHSANKGKKLTFWGAGTGPK